jgi:threonine aldolase
MQQSTSDSVDLRSDTITKPSQGMRQAMANAEVGDDVFEDDPTIQELEKRTAALLGKEAALFAPSGTMTNQIAVRCHTQIGDRIILEANSHIYLYEAGGISALSGVIPTCLAGKNGIFSAEDLASSILPEDVHFAPARLVCIENTHNRGGGKTWPLEKILSVTAQAKKSQLAFHLDGARIWNAAAASGLSEAELAAPFDSASVCFSKGLGAPIGSALVGTRDFIHKARRVRKQFGGGMRQVGILGAGALYALENNRSRLHEDHSNAKDLAKGIAGLPGLTIDPEAVETNIACFDVPKNTAAGFAEHLQKRGIRLLAIGPSRIRVVTNLMVNSAQIEQAVEAIKVTATELYQNSK